VALGLASYVDDLAALLTEMRRVVRPGGLVVVSVANARSPDWWLRRTLRRPAAALGFRGVLTSGVPLRTRRPAAWREAARTAGLQVEAERGHDFTLFPLSRLLPGPAVAVSRSVEALDSRALDALSSEVVLLLRRTGGEPAARPPPARPVRLVRVIARLNVGGPALHTTLATAGLRPAFETTLATGRVAPGEAEATDLLQRFDVRPERVPGLGRAPSPVDDLRALVGMLSLIRRVRPQVVHTHTAKAGAIGRLAARLCGVPAVVHTFHGHVFHGYFGRLGSTAAVAAERVLALLSDRVLAVSDEVGRDLVERYRVAPRSKVEVVPLGLPLEPLRDCSRHAGSVRAELGIEEDAPVALMTGRLVPVKEPEVALEAWRAVRREIPTARLLVAGAGSLHAELVARGDDGVHWLGWRSDIDRLLADADVALLTSRNEGTPVALIEAAAAAVPAVATRVGGVPSVVLDGETGLLVERGDVAGLVDALLTLFRDHERRRSMGEVARVRALSRWSDRRLLRDLRRVYAELGPRVGSGP
jgi:glycosyltransferase involved in cell wall biosynthesis